MGAAVIGWHGGKNRRLFEKRCAYCTSPFLVPKHLYARQKHCSRECMGREKTSKQCVMVTCHTCGTTVNRPQSKLARSKTGYRFCSRTCKDTAQRMDGVKAIQPPHYGTAKFNKDVIIRQRGRACETCRCTEWMGQPVPLDLDHTDGNTDNNLDENLRLLCPNCHAQTPTFCGRNLGKGRKSRRLARALMTTSPTSDGRASPR